jgi:hypothetical protein
MKPQCHAICGTWRKEEPGVKTPAVQDCLEEDFNIKPQQAEYPMRRDSGYK